MGNQQINDQPNIFVVACLGQPENKQITKSMFFFDAGNQQTNKLILQIFFLFITW